MEEKAINSLINLHNQKDPKSNFQCFVEFLDTTGGRDKVIIRRNQFCRLFQYLSKFIVPLTKNYKRIDKLVVFIDNLGACFDLTRKVIAIIYQGFTNWEIYKCISKCYFKNNGQEGMSFNQES